MNKRHNFWITLFLLPTIALFILVFAIPVGTVIYTSFFEWKGINKGMSFNGIQNYIQAFSVDRTFMRALKNTGIWVLLQSTIHVGIGTLLAIILADRPKGWKFVRTSFMVPNMISASALGVILLNVFNPQFGVVNTLVRKIGFKDFSHNWYFHPNTAFGTVTITFLLYAGLITILVLTEIMSISPDIYESAAIDGAISFQQKIYITLPLLRNILGTCMIISATSMLKEFELIFLTTKGGPGDLTINLPLYLYKTALIENNYGYANMMGVILIAIGIICIGIINKLFSLGRSDV